MFFSLISVNEQRSFSYRPTATNKFNSYVYDIIRVLIFILWTDPREEVDVRFFGTWARMLHVDLDEIENQRNNFHENYDFLSGKNNNV